MPLDIDYQSKGFPGVMPRLKGQHTLTTSWDDLLWAAITVGRPNRQFVFQHGTASLYEAIFRFSLIRMALEQRWASPRLRRTAAARTLDPTEKGAVNYFLGVTICKLFAAELLDAPWMLHLDVFRPALDVQLASRSRPDLVGQTQRGKWVALECKGRISPPDSAVKRRAKQQATRVVSVSGTQPAFHIGGVAFFKNDVLQFYWEDPEPEPEIKNPIRVQPTAEMWSHYYRPALELIQSSHTYFAQMREERVLIPVEEADIRIGIHPVVLGLLATGRWEEAREAAQGRPAPPYHVDGIAVEAGPTWLERLVDFEG
jgi:hypothetical protein